MKQYRITVDTGTTNTRAGLWKDGVRVQEQRVEVGVRCTAVEGSNHRLQEAVRDCMRGLLENQGIGWDEVECVLASGMITANVGLSEIPHLVAPVGLGELAAGMKTIEIPAVCPLPLRFVPGIKNHADAVTRDNFTSMDIMRGEEVEVMALLAVLPKGAPYLFVLPGSHTKFVATDAAGRIMGCVTTLTGELLSVLTKETILANAVDRQFVTADSYDVSLVRLGYYTAQQQGLAHAAFATRILHQFGGGTPTQNANYLLGVTLQQDVLALQMSALWERQKSSTLVVAGKGVLCEAIFDLLEREDAFESVRRCAPEEGKSLSALGMFAVYEHGC